MADHRGYLLAGGAQELDRLTLQARVWEPEVERLLDRIGVPSGARCIDLGCGAMGILAPLKRRVGPAGHVVGVDMDAKSLGAARALLDEQRMADVELLEGDAYRTGLPDASFDVTHIRFVFAPVGRDDELLNEMLRLTKPGGTIVIQEPDASSWSCYPVHPSWPVLKDAIVKTFRQGGGDFNAGQRTFGMLRRAGLQDVGIRAAVLALQDRHPYMRSPLQLADSLRSRILANDILSEDEYNRVCADYEHAIAQPDTTVTTFTVTQVWGRKPTA